MVAQQVGSEGIDEPDSGWEASLEDVPARVDATLAQLIPLVNHLFGGGSYITSTFASEERSRKLVAAVLQALSDGTDAGDLTAYQQRDDSKPPRRPNTVTLLIDHDRIPAGTRLMYRPSATEEQAIGDWLNADPRRAYATWV
ncbi:hypothetical protein, partial [Micrococcus luteus]